MNGAQSSPAADPLRLALFLSLGFVSLVFVVVGCGRLSGKVARNPAGAASGAGATPIPVSPSRPTPGSAAAFPPPPPVATLQPTPGLAATPRLGAVATPSEPDVALKGKATASEGQDTAQLAIDGNPKTAWNAKDYPVQWILVTLDKPYLVDQIDLHITLAPAGKTSQEVWLGDPSGGLTLYKTFDNVPTRDGQTFTVEVQPPRVINRVLVRTTAGPSFVAWSQIQVFGRAAPNGLLKASGSTGGEAWINWPSLALTGGFDLPTQVTNAGDGSNRLFVLEQHGMIRVLASNQEKGSVFLDLTDRVKCCEEQGLLSIAFPPGYANKRYFYVSYTNHTNDLIISRFRTTADPNVADPKSEQVILDIPEPTTVHHSGHLVFGPDGYLYVGSGDGGVPADNANNAQDPDSLLGKILRIDVESGATPYAIPPTNPFINRPGYRPEVWALGLRNPWGFSFDSKTGDLYIGDVGENNYEEIDYQPAGQGGENYGWNIMEGLHCFATPDCNTKGLTLPVIEYTHVDGCAVMGGTVYRGAQFPRMQGVYYYADLCSGRIWGLLKNGDGWQNTLLLTAPFQVSSIGQDEAGNLWVTDYNHGGIMKLVDVPPSTPTPTHT